MNGLLHQLQVVITATCDKNQTQDASSMESVNDKIAELREFMEQSNESTTTFIETLKNASSNPGSNYYWLIFVALYGGIYFLQ
jgi:phosphopantetheine adenylyltransferase